MTPERENELRYKDLTVSELIEVLQHHLDTSGDSYVFAKNIDGNTEAVYGADVFQCYGSLRIAP